MAFGALCPYAGADGDGQEQGASDDGCGAHGAAATRWLLQCTILGEANVISRETGLVIRRKPSRRSFLQTSTALVGLAPLTRFLPGTEPSAAAAPLIAYVGTFSSPLRDVLPTQVDLPPGNGRGIHLFRVDRATGALDAERRPRDGHEPELPGPERRRHPAVFGQRDRSGRRGQGGHGQRLRRSTGPTGS